MRILILFTCLAAACALPAFEHVRLTREQLDSKAREVEEFVTLLDQIKKIALGPSDDADWKHPDSDVRDIEAFLAAIDLLRNIVYDSEDDWQVENEELDADEFLDILDHLKSWVLATGAVMEQLDIQGRDKDSYLAVLSLIRDIESFIEGEARDKEEFVAAVDLVRKITLITGGDWEQVNVPEHDKKAFEDVLNVLKEIRSFEDSFES